jgi:hypothetical protein
MRRRAGRKGDWDVESVSSLGAKSEISGIVADLEAQLAQARS